MSGSCIAASHALHCIWASSRQRGSIVVMAAIGISTMVILLASIDIGYLFFQKRELQKIADLSALAGAQQLGRSTVSAGNACPSSVITTAEANAKVAQNFSGAITVSCGNWDPVAETTAPHYRAIATGIMPNAVSVHVSQSFRSFFGAWASRAVSAVAIATADAQIAVFSVGSRLLRINDAGVVPGLLTKLGVGMNGVDIASYNGLANVSIKTSGLLRALGVQLPVNADVGTIKQSVLDLNTGGCSNGACTLETLLGAMTTLVGQQDFINLLGISAAQLKLPVQIFSNANGRGGILALVDAANGNSALSTNINALDLITTAIGVANGHNGIKLELGANLPAGILQSETKIGIVEPPSIGIGGKDTMAYTSQVRVFTHLQSNLLKANLLRADLPIAIEIVNGSAKIDELCQEKMNGKDTAKISVQAPIFQLCIGSLTADSAFSNTAPACDASLPSHPFLTLLGTTLPLSSLAVPGLQNIGSHTFVKGETYTFGNNNLPLGTTTKNLVDNLLDSLLARLLGATYSQGQSTPTKEQLAGGLLGAVTGNVLGTAVTQVEQALSALQKFTNDVKANTDLFTALGTALESVLNTVGNLVGGLLNGVGNLIGQVVCGVLNPFSPSNANQCTLAKQFEGNQGSSSVSKVLLTILGLITQLLEPLLNDLGKALAAQLNDLLGIGLGQVDVTLIDLKCGGGDSVRLVY